MIDQTQRYYQYEKNKLFLSKEFSLQNNFDFANVEQEEHVQMNLFQVFESVRNHHIYHYSKQKKNIFSELIFFRMN